MNQSCVALPAHSAAHRDGCQQKLPMLPNLAAAFLLLSVALAAGCGAARPSKYYQLTVPNDLGTDAATDPYPVSLLLSPLMASHLYREDRIVYSSGGTSMGASRCK